MPMIRGKVNQEQGLRLPGSHLVSQDIGVVDTITKYPSIIGFQGEIKTWDCWSLQAWWDSGWVRISLKSAQLVV